MVGKLKEVSNYAEDLQPFLQKMVKEVLCKRPDDVQSFLRSYLGGSEMPTLVRGDATRAQDRMQGTLGQIDQANKNEKRCSLVFPSADSDTEDQKEVNPPRPPSLATCCFNQGQPLVPRR